MRILQVIPSLAAGGAETVALGLSKRLVALGHEVHLILLYHPSDAQSDHLSALGIVAHSLRKRPGIDFAAVRRFSQIARQVRPNVIHTHQHALKYALAASTPWDRCGLVHTLHTMSGHERSAVTALTHRLGRGWGVRAVGVSPAISAAFVAAGAYRHVATVPNGVDTDAYRPNPDVGRKLRAEIGLHECDFVLIQVARFNPVKNHRDTVLAAGRLAKDQRGLKVLFAGEGAKRTDTEVLIRELGIESSFRFLGVRSDVPDLLQAADAFVLPSSVEGSPISLLEAMASGLPCVCSKVGGIPDVIASGINGMLFEAGSVDDFVAACTELIRDPERRRMMGASARATVLARYSIEAMTEAYLRIYEESQP